MIIYLAGAINGCTDEECKDWRNYLKSTYDFMFIDPMRRDYRGMENEYFKDIVEGDKKDIDNSTHLIVNYDKPSAGTSMEILYAWERGKIILIVANPNINLSPWIIYHSNKIFDRFDDVMEFLEAYK